MDITPRHIRDFVRHFVALYNEKRSGLEEIRSTADPPPLIEMALESVWKSIRAVTMKEDFDPSIAQLEYAAMLVRVDPLRQELGVLEGAAVTEGQEVSKMAELIQTGGASVYHTLCHYFKIWV
jgi:hypothetical protein